MFFDSFRLSSPNLKSATALAGALIPGSQRIPAAGGDTAQQVHELVSELHPSIATALNVAQKVLCASAIAYTGRRFESLSADNQQALLRRWESDSTMRSTIALLSLAYKFVHFDRPGVYDKLGGKLNVVQNLERPRWLQQVCRADDWADGRDLDCDVVVVGTGAGGAVAGRELANKGLAVVFVEEGEHYRRDSFCGSSIKAHQRFYQAAMVVGNAPMPIFYGRLVGGSTAINGGTCFRTPDWVLDRWCEDLGTDEFSAPSMAPYFERVEAMLQVQPSERKYIGPIADIFARGCDKLGWSHFAIRRNAPDCDGSGFCDFGCRTDARRATNISYIPSALDKGAVLLAGLRVDNILLAGNKAAGVSGLTTKGRRIRVRARAVVLSMGAISTPLLLASQGICNRSGQAGRNLTIHPSSSMSALFDDEVRGHAHIPQGYGTKQFLREGMLITAAQPDHNVAALLFPFAGRRLMYELDRIDNIASFALMTSDASSNGRVWRGVGGFPAVSYDLTQTDVDLMHTAMVHAGEMALAAGARRLYPLAIGREPIATPKEFDAFRKATLKPSDLTWVSYHPLGSCKMGSDPKTSVVNLDGETHDVRGLHIADASTVQGPIGVNPQITVMAMATRAADKLAARL